MSRKILAPEILPTPNQDRFGSARERTRRRLGALLNVSATGGIALATSCIYGTVDMMPQPTKCTDQQPEDWPADLEGYASWSDGNIVLEIYLQGQGLSLDPTVTIQGGTLVSFDTSNRAVLTVTPDPDAMEILVDGTLACAGTAGVWGATLTVGDTGTEVGVVMR